MPRAGKEGETPNLFTRIVTPVKVFASGVEWRNRLRGVDPLFMDGIQPKRAKMPKSETAGRGKGGLVLW